MQDAMDLPAVQCPFILFVQEGVMHLMRVLENTEMCLLTRRQRANGHSLPPLFENSTISRRHRAARL